MSASTGASRASAGRCACAPHRHCGLPGWSRAGRNRCIRRRRSGGLGLKGKWLLDALPVDHHHLARLDVAHIFGADDVEGAGFGGEDQRAVQLAHHQRAHAIGIAHADQLLGGERHQRIGALHLAQRVDQLVDDARLVLRAVRWTMVSVSEVDWKIAPCRPASLAQGMGIGEIAVMGDGDAAAGQIGEDGLDVAQPGCRRRWNSGCGRWQSALQIAGRPGSCGRKASPTRPG